METSAYVPAGVSPLPWHAVNVQTHLGPEHADTVAQWELRDGQCKRILCGNGPLLRRIAHAANSYPEACALMERLARCVHAYDTHGHPGCDACAARAFLDAAREAARSDPRGRDEATRDARAESTDPYRGHPDA